MLRDPMALPPVPFPPCVTAGRRPCGREPCSPLRLCRVKAKKGVNLVNTKSRNLQWLVNSELLMGGKHSTATVDVAKIDGALPR